MNNIFNITTANMLGIKYVWEYIYYGLAGIPGCCCLLVLFSFHISILVLTLIVMLILARRQKDSKEFSRELQRRLAESRKNDHKDRCCGFC